MYATSINLKRVRYKKMKILTIKITITQLSISFLIYMIKSYYMMNE
jgi:hypothetical protein